MLLIIDFWGFLNSYFILLPFFLYLFNCFANITTLTYLKKKTVDICWTVQNFWNKEKDSIGRPEQMLNRFRQHSCPRVWLLAYWHKLLSFVYIKSKNGSLLSFILRCWSLLTDNIISLYVYLNCIIPTINYLITKLSPMWGPTFNSNLGVY